MLFLITRSDPHAEQLAQSLDTLGVRHTCSPLMTIEPLSLSGEARSHLLNLDLFNTVIVVSANAAQQLALHIDHYWPQLPMDIQWIAIGKATANALTQHIPELHESDIVVPDGIDSEALLASTALEKPEHAKILLAKGVGGRELIQQQLSQAGAKVTELELYRRAPSYAHSESLIEALQKSPDFIQIASGDAFFCLIELIKHHHKNSYQKTLQPKQLIQQQRAMWLVPSERVANILHEQGIPSEQVATCQGASNQAVLDELKSPRINIG